MERSLTPTGKEFDPQGEEFDPPGEEFDLLWRENQPLWQRLDPLETDNTGMRIQPGRFVPSLRNGRLKEGSTKYLRKTGVFR
jgi:hypothetical protein